MDESVKQSAQEYNLHLLINSEVFSTDDFIFEHSFLFSNKFHKKTT